MHPRRLTPSRIPRALAPLGDERSSFIRDAARSVMMMGSFLAGGDRLGLAWVVPASASDISSLSAEAENGRRSRWTLVRD